MAYGELYDMDFTDLLGNAVTFELREKDYAGAKLGNFQAGADPIMVETKVESEDIYEVPRFITTEISLVNTDSLEWFNSVLTSNDDDKYQIYASANTSRITTYLNKEGYSEPYTQNNKIVNFQGYEGFHILQTIDISDVNGNQFTGYKTLIAVLAGAFKKFPHQWKIRVACNLFETNHNTSTCALNQTYINTNSLYDNDQLISCFEAIRRICEVFGLTVILSDGRIWLIRVAELYKSSITYYQYDSNGSFESSSTLSPQVILNGNAVARASRIDYINNNVSKYVKRGFRDIYVNVKRIKKISMWEYTYFQTFYNTSFITDDELPSGWTKDGILQTNKLTFTQGSTTVDAFYKEGGQTYKILVLKFITNQGEDLFVHSGEIYYKQDNSLVLPVKQRIKVTVRYRMYYNGAVTSSVSASFNVRISQHLSTGTTRYWDDVLGAFVNATNNQGQANNIDNAVSCSPTKDFEEAVFEFEPEETALNDGTDYIKVHISQLYPKPTGIAYNAIDLHIKNVGIDMQYQELGSQNTLPILDYQYVDIKDDFVRTNNANKYGNETYEKDLYYGDVGADYNLNVAQQYALEYMAVNNLYYLDSGTFKPTGSWDYDSKGLNRSIQRVMLYDLTYQYSSDTVILNGDIMGAGLKGYNVFVDDKEGSNKLYFPLNTMHDYKRCVLSGEFMEIKSSEINAGDYLADENDDAILDELGNEILVNF